MAPKPRNSKPQPAQPPSSTTSSSDDEEPEELSPRRPSKKPVANATPDDSSSSDAGEDPEEEEGESTGSSEEEMPSQPAAKPAPPKPPALGSPSESESESESESGSESDPVPPPPPPSNPVNSKPISQASSQSKKPPASGSTTPTKVSTPKKPTVSASDEFASNASKRKLFERFWKDGDDLKILKGIIDFHAQHGTDVRTKPDMDLLHGFLKQFLSSDFSKLQLVSKIRKMKQKYEGQASRLAHCGEEGLRFRKPEEEAVYELSKKMWGDSNSEGGNEETRNHENENRPRKRLKAIAVAASKEKNTGVAADETEGSLDSDSYSFLWKSIDFSGKDYAKELVKKNGLKALDRTKAERLDKEFQKLAMAEMKLQLRRSELTMEAIQFITKAVEIPD